MKKNVFRILALMLAFVLILGTFAACGGNEDDETTTEETSEDATIDETEDNSEDISEDASEDQTEEDTSKADEVKVPSTNQEILDAYTRVMNKAKASAPAYKRKEYQTIPSSSPDREVRQGSAAISIIMGIAEQSFTTEDKAEVDDRKKGDSMEWFPVVKNDKGNYLTDVNFIKEAKAEKLSNGNIKLSITLKDEIGSQPTPAGSGAPLSKIGAMFYPLPMSDITNALEDPTVARMVKVEKFEINYHNCTATIEYNPANDELVTMEQQIIGGLDAKGRATVINFDFYQNIYSTLKTWDFVY